VSPKRRAKQLGLPTASPSTCVAHAGGKKNKKQEKPVAFLYPASFLAATSILLFTLLDSEAGGHQLPHGTRFRLRGPRRHHALRTRRHRYLLRVPRLPGTRAWSFELLNCRLVPIPFQLSYRDIWGRLVTGFLSLQWKRGGSKDGSCDGCRSCRDVVRKRTAAVRVRATAPRRVEAVAMGSSAETEKELEVGAVTTETGQQEMAASGGGVEDPYGEDRATEELPVTPWAFSVAR
jgi:hypothetical protein